MELTECISQHIKQNNELNEELYSLIIFGSYVRGDFIEGVSDIDFYAVLNSEPGVILALRQILEKCSDNMNIREVDVAWSFLSELDDPVNIGWPFKFLTIYQNDFVNNHILVYGNDIVDLLPKYDDDVMIRRRFQRMESSTERYKGNLKMLHIGAGEVIHFMAYCAGFKSLRKKDVYDYLLEIGDREALEIFSAYLDNRGLIFTEEYLIDFIKSRITRFQLRYGM